MPNLKLLVLEDQDDYIESNYRSPVRDYDRRGVCTVELDVVKTKPEALSRLKQSRYDGAILDLRLTADADEAEGNAVAKEIHSHYLMPVAIVTAFNGELAPELRTLTEKPSTLFRYFNKGGDGNVVFEFFLRVDRTQVLQIFQPGGQFNRVLSTVFWDHLGPMVERLDQGMAGDEVRRRILRHTVFHVLAILQRDGNCENWDPYLNEEMYIVPAVGTRVGTGDLLASPAAGGGLGDHFFLVTPACDVDKITRALTPPAAGASPRAAKPPLFYQIVRIIPLTAASLIDRPLLKEIANKTNTRYHLLPPSATYPGGIIDFWQLHNLPAARLAEYHRIGQVTDPFTKDIVARIGAWISRQGSPDFQEPVMEQAWAKINPPPLLGKV
jgi:ActR/RegA family two-component response regulator